MKLLSAITALFIFWGATGDTTFIHPLKTESAVSQGYGMHTHPVLKTKRMHKGVDYDVDEGTPIYASASGTVVSIDSTSVFGKMILISHGSQTQTRYGHLSKYEHHIAVGTAVDQGELIGLSGNSGMSYGPHLHFEVLVRGKAVDPIKYLTK